MSAVRIHLAGIGLLCVAMLALAACADRTEIPKEPVQIPLAWGTLDGSPGFHVVFIGDFDKDGAYLVDHDQAIHYMLVNQLVGDVFVLADFEQYLSISHVAQVIPGEDFGGSSGGGRKRAIIGAAPAHRYVRLAGRGASTVPGALDDQILAGQLPLAEQGTHPNANFPFTVTISALLSGYVRADGRRFTTRAQQDLICRMQP